MGVGGGDGRGSWGRSSVRRLRGGQGQAGAGGGEGQRQGQCHAAAAGPSHHVQAQSPTLVRDRVRDRVPVRPGASTSTASRAHRSPGRPEPGAAQRRSAGSLMFRFSSCCDVLVPPIFCRPLRDAGLADAAPRMLLPLLRLLHGHLLAHTQRGRSHTTCRHHCSPALTAHCRLAVGEVLVHYTLRHTGSVGGPGRPRCLKRLKALRP